MLEAVYESGAEPNALIPVQPANANKVTLIGNEALKQLPKLNGESLFVLHIIDCDLRLGESLPNYRYLHVVLLKNCTNIRHFVWPLLNCLKKMVIVNSTPERLKMFSSDEWSVQQVEEKTYYLKK